MQLQLKELRKKAGYSNRNDFARAIGVSESTYRSWETGARSIKLSEATKIADFLDISLDELAGRWDYGDYLTKGKFVDDRQQQINDIYSHLNDANRDSALASVEGIAAMQARKKAGAKGFETSEVVA